MRHLITVAAMTVSGIGGGAAVGWVNMPHAAAASGNEAVFAPPVTAQLGVVRLTAKLVAAKQAAEAAAAAKAAAAKADAARAAAAAAAAAAKAAAATTAQATAAAAAAAKAALAPPVPRARAVASAVSTRSQTPAGALNNSADTCGAALAYLRANSAPGFAFQCPGYALGHQAMTCINVSGVCPHEDLIVISTVCPASYMNEAHNSWIMAGYRTGSIDPYGYCH